MRRCCVVTLALLALYVLALLAATFAYSGGSWTDGASRGFSWSRNFFCDLLRSRALDGSPNDWGQRLSIVAFAALGIALFPFWWLAAELLPERRRRLVIGAGSGSALALAVLALLPSDEFPVLHGVVALGAGVLGLLAAASSIGARLGREPRASARRFLGALAFGSAAVHVALHVHVIHAGGAETAWEPSVQKFAALALLGWMLATVRAAWLVSEKRTS